MKLSLMNPKSLPFLCELVREAIEKQGAFVLSARGFSMMPFIEDGDNVEIVKAHLDDVRAGDIVCYGIRKPDSEFPAMRVHRVLRKMHNSLFVKGDTLLHVETVLASQLFGKVSAVQKGSRWTECKTPRVYLFFALPVLYVYALSYKLKTTLVPEFLWDAKPLKFVSSKMSSLFLYLPRVMSR